jgi:hypothetical protein
MVPIGCWFITDGGGIKRRFAKELERTDMWTV